MNIHIPKWIFAAIVGAAPMLGVVFFILVSCTLLGIVQRCKINLTKTYANRKRYISNDHSSLDNGKPNSNVLFKPQSSIIIISPFDDIPMKDIDAESLSKAYSDGKDDFSNSPIVRRNRNVEGSQDDSDYDNGSSSIFNDNDYQQDRLSLIETSSQRKGGGGGGIKHQKSPDTIIHV